MSESLPDGYEIPVHLSLTQPILLGGVPRRFAILNTTFTLMIALGLKLWWLGIPLGVVIHVAAIALTRRDPIWFEVFKRHLRQPSELDV